MATLTTTPVCAPPRSGAALAAAAVGALLSEAALTPKPGLVDLRGKGAHADMDVALMTASALALRDTFTRLAATGAAGHHDARLRADLARIGRDGEVAMMRATGGVNTHRGAIWALGLTVAAVAALPHADTAAVLRKAAGVAAHPDPAAPPVRTKGARPAPPTGLPEPSARPARASPAPHGLCGYCAGAGPQGRTRPRPA